MGKTTTLKKESWSVGVGSSTYMDGRRAPDFDCGHSHKSYESAEKCEGKLKGFWCENCDRPWGSCVGTYFTCRSPRKVCSARWYNSYIFRKVDGKIVHGLDQEIFS